ncbi:FAD binding domain-containing protein [Georgenia yuyongxinii]|uniref:Xanthine dehydrogenase family protein subunit M n=1 Tax=Georgenia yuyongxinii TaxID=2589797 RepID=A0A552WV04_9MICO|nr:xanthine dehydrogenase family protein subunit M [Georgenia yuyongxinii]TRW46678.1 xanthine dehydrogenase family protein subunit M [Georgenia yuyongxinii]
MLPFAYARPATLADAVALLLAHDGARLLAGGTDLTVGLRDGKIRPGLVVDVKRLDDLPPGISAADGRVAISATTALTDVAAHPTVRRHFPALVEAADVVGSIQIRNRATLAGNVCNASPAADTVPALAVYEAAVVIHGPDGVREMPVTEFILGNRHTALGPGELVVAITLPVPDRPLGAAFARMTRRRGVDLATVNLCCRVDECGAVVYAYGAVAPKPLLVRDDSGVLTEPAATRADQDAALAALVAQASPITDVRASAEYRLAMVRVLSRRALHAATNRLKTKED